MNRQQLFAASVALLGLAALPALPTFAAQPRHRCDSCDKVGPGEYTCGGEWFCENCMDQHLRGYMDARGAIEDGASKEQMVYESTFADGEYRTGFRLGMDHHAQEMKANLTRTA